MLSESHMPQIQFDKKYITASEIMQRLQLSRAALFYARQAGRLPGAIVVNKGQIFIWDREQVEPILASWGK